MLLRSSQLKRDVIRGQRPGLYDFQGPFDVEDHVGLRLRLVRKWNGAKERGSATELIIHHSADVYKLETAFLSGLSSNHVSEFSPVTHLPCTYLQKGEILSNI